MYPIRKRIIKRKVNQAVGKSFIDRKLPSDFSLINGEPQTVFYLKSVYNKLGSVYMKWEEIRNNYPNQ